MSDSSKYKFEIDGLTITYPPEMLPFPLEAAEVFVCENHRASQKCENCQIVPIFETKH